MSVGFVGGGLGVAEAGRPLRRRQALAWYLRGLQPDSSGVRAHGLCTFLCGISVISHKPKSTSHPPLSS